MPTKASCARRESSRTPPSASGSIREGLDAVGEWSDPLGKLGEVVHLVESPRVQEGTFDERFLALPERVIVTAMQSHQRYFPLGGNRFAFVANGGDPDVVRQGNERVLAGRLEDATLHVRARRQARDRGAARASCPRSRSSPRPAPSPTRPSASSSSWTSSAAARPRVRRPGSRRPTRRPSSCASSPTSRATSAPSTRASPAIRRRSRRRSRSTTCPIRPAARCPRPRRGRSSPPRRRSTTSASLSGSGSKPTGSRDPYGLRRAAIGLLRLATEGAPRRSTAPRAFPDDELRDFVEERLEGLLDVPVEFVRAARKSGARELGAVAALARFLAALEDERLEPVHTVFTRASRIAGSAGQTAASTPSC